MRHTINHPMADSISVQQTTRHLCTPWESSEIAFFSKGKWVTKVIPEFAEYAEYSSGDTRVYGWVPNELIESFLETYNA